VQLFKRSASEETAKKTILWPLSNSTAPISEKWLLYADSKVAWQKLAGWAVLNRGLWYDIAKDAKFERHNSFAPAKDIYEILQSSESMSNAVKLLAVEKCTFGLVLIATMRKNERVEALEALAGYADWKSIYDHNFGTVPEIQKILVNYNGTAQNREYMSICNMPEAESVALAKDSPALAEMVHCHVLRENGEERALPLTKILLNHGKLHAVDFDAGKFSKEAIISFGAYLDKIPRKTGGITCHDGRTTARIAALSPDIETRRLAIRLTEEIPDQNVAYRLCQIAGESEYVDTAKETLDKAFVLIKIDTNLKLALKASGETHYIDSTGSTQPIRIDGLSWPLMDALEPAALPEVRAYAIDCLFKLFDTYQCYGDISHPDMPEGVTPQIMKRLETDFGTLVKKKHYGALLWLFENGSKNAADAMRILGENLASLPGDKPRMVAFVALCHPDEQVKAQALNQFAKAFKQYKITEIATFVPKRFRHEAVGAG
jgi:hypothetical protein